LHQTSLQASHRPITSPSPSSRHSV